MHNKSHYISRLPREIPKSQNSLSQLVFASSLQLEEAIELLTSLADDQHPMILTDISPDKVEFEIDYLPQGVSLAKVKGNLQRWNGIETKLEAKGDVIRIDATETKQAKGGALISGLALTLTGCGLALAYGQSWLIAPIIFGAMGMGFYGLDFSDGTKTTNIVLFRERDYLFQRLIDAFKMAGDVEAL